MTVAELKTCSCAISFEPLICGACGGTLSVTTGVFAKIDAAIQQWLYDLDSESRLTQTLSMYMAIDKQVRQGAPIAAAVQQVTRQFELDFAGLQAKVDRTIREKLDDLKGGNSDSIRQITEAVNQALQVITLDVRTLIEQGRSVTEVESKVKEATATLQSYLATMKLPTVRGEEGEKDVLRELEEAFLGQTCVRIEPIGGADATDVVVKFYHGGVEIGRSLVEVKSRKSWSNDYLDQVRQDMKRYNTAFAILAVEKLPKVAKPR